MDAEIGFTCTISGTKGQGKTYLGKRLFSTYPKSALFLDTIGAAYDLKGLHATARKIPDANKIKKLVSILREKKKVILHLENFLVSELVEIVNNLSKALLAYKWDNLMVIIDEVGDYIPQDKNAGYAQELERLIRIGRNYGITKMVLITQRLTKPNKEALALSESFIIFKTTYHLDTERLRELFGLTKESFEEAREQIITLKVGDYLFYRDGEYKVIRRGGADGII